MNHLKWEFLTVLRLSLSSRGSMPSSWPSTCNRKTCDSVAGETPSIVHFTFGLDGSITSLHCGHLDKFPPSCRHPRSTEAAVGCPWSLPLPGKEPKSFRLNKKKVKNGYAHHSLATSVKIRQVEFRICFWFLPTVTGLYPHFLLTNLVKKKTVRSWTRQNPPKHPSKLKKTWSPS